ncbi:hypothetical protein AVEN_262675-1 [Araneus ventricosus]|uniref:Uncharacterized protein n=1 Tax=Araneus ventricosus TaxID=182803 RepID=A0A4Y2J203_ARAVE|nr:hypothetical protein AVEN_262675-1 [Araneus ventricosus]
MENLCLKCGELYFRDEKNTRGIYTHCCHNGNIIEQASVYPVEMKGLMDGSDEGRTSASMGAQIVPSTGRGAYCCRIHGQIYHRTSHLHPAEAGDTSPGGEDSDYFTPEDPSTTILVDQGTDTSLDTPQPLESGTINDSVEKLKGDYPVPGKYKTNRERYAMAADEPENNSSSVQDKRKKNSDSLNKPESTTDSLASPNSRSLVVNLENPSSLPGTPASNASVQSSGDSFSSTSSTRLLLRNQSYETLPE